LSAIYHGTGSVKNAQDAKAILSKTFGLDEKRAAALIDRVAKESLDLLKQFNIEPGRMLPFSQILQEANEQLSRLNLSYETLVIEHREAKEKAERLAVELKEANERLRHVAFRDGLTGLYNHRYLQEALDRELARAARYSHSLSLIMFDIDCFKSINDTHGHQRGDTVLREVGRMALRGTRSSDTVARYGGEEFVILLAETPLAGAMIKAESFRASVEAAEIQADGVSIRVTISLGVFSFEPGLPVTKDVLINGADRALYRSKNEGRNRTTAWRLAAFSSG
jgi:diguanylate cyclase (GGDEF)-like protein